jgi:hypothetical protein
MDNNRTSAAVKRWHDELKEREPHSHLPSQLEENLAIAKKYIIMEERIEFALRALKDPNPLRVHRAKVALQNALDYDPSPSQS